MRGLRGHMGANDRRFGGDAARYGAGKLLFFERLQTSIDPEANPGLGYSSLFLVDS